ncbi:MAG TPA: glycosyltransferase family 4 protein, partial [Kiritimatiellia bacterium]|nr:glycosyltransferase family 4 protein [Kiritimatiellia bacterium]
VLLVNYRYFLSGGPESYLFKVEELFRRHGDETIAFSSQDSRNRPCPQAGYFTDSRGGDVYFEKIRRTPGNLLRLLKGAFYNPEAARKLERLIDAERPDAAYVLQQVNQLSPSVFFAAKRKGLRVVHRLSDYNLFCPRFDFLRAGAPCEKCLHGSLWNAVRHRCVHGSLPASLVRVLSMWFHRLSGAFDRIDAFVVTNRFMEEKLAQSGVARDRIHRIPTFTESARIEPRYGHDGYVLYLGRVRPEKGAPCAVEAMKHLRDLDVRLRLTGTPADDANGDIARLIAENGLADRVEFVGFQQGEALEKLISGALAVLCPSVLYDNLPNAILEAFAHGKPVVASNHGSFPGAIDDGRTGLLFAPNDAADLAAKIRRLWTEPGLAATLGRNARLQCEREHAPETHYRRLVAALTGQPAS